MNESSETFNRRFLAVFAVALVAAGMAYLAAITFLPIPAPNVRFADTILGAILGTVISAPVGFYFGSSASSRSKDRAISEMLQQPPAADATATETTTTEAKP